MLSHPNTNNVINVDQLIGKEQPTQLAVLDTSVKNVRVALAVTEANGLEVEVLDDREEYDALPLRPKGTRQVSETLSFLDELTRYPLTQGQSTLWGDYKRGRIAAIYNDHHKQGADHRDNRLVLQLTADEDWTAWHNLSGQFLPQNEFGDALQDLLHTVIDPSQAELLQVIYSVRASSSGEFESRIDHSNGSHKVLYKQDVTTRAGKSGELEVPQTITLRLRPWEGQPETYDVVADFRLRVQGSELKLCIQLKPTAQILRQAWADTVKKIVDTVDIPVLATRNQGDL